MVKNIVEPREVDKAQMGWFCNIGGVTIVEVGFLVLTPKNDEKTTKIMVPMDEEMNRI